MLGHMKKPSTKGKTKKVSKLQFIVDDKEYLYTNIPAVKVRSILEFLNAMGESETPSAGVKLGFGSEYVTADELWASDIKKIGGDESNRNSAHMVRSARKSEGMTQVELSKKLGVDQRNLSQIENAKRPVGKKIAKNLSEIFNINYKVFLSD
jgi:DNA-binding XRE family transcriptional regulator